MTMQISTRGAEDDGPASGVLQLETAYLSSNGIHRPSRFAYYEDAMYVSDYSEDATSVSDVSARYLFRMLSLNVPAWYITSDFRVTYYGLNDSWIRSNRAVKHHQHNRWCLRAKCIDHGLLLVRMGSRPGMGPRTFASWVSTLQSSSSNHSTVIHQERSPWCLRARCCLIQEGIVCPSMSMHRST